MGLNRRIRVVLLPALILASARWAAASERKIPIFRPTTITKSGSYIVVRDFTSEDGPAIRIVGGDVSIDLRGRTIGSPPRTRVVDIADETKSVYLRNGRLRGGDGVVMDFLDGRFPHPSMIRLESLDVFGGGISLSHLDSKLPTVEVLNCRVFGGGIGVFNDPGQVIARIVGNYVETQGNGIWLWNGINSEVTGNIVRFGGDRDIRLSGLRLSGLQFSLVHDNTIDRLSEPSGIGIFITKETSDNAGAADDVLENNQITGATIGIAISSYSAVIRNNYLSGNLLDGIEVTDNVWLSSVNIMVDSNLSTGNGGCGIRFRSGGGHVFKDNDVRGNGIYGIAGECGGDLGTNVDGGGNIL